MRTLPRTALLLALVAATAAPAHADPVADACYSALRNLPVTVHGPCEVIDPAQTGIYVTPCDVRVVPNPTDPLGWDEVWVFDGAVLFGQYLASVTTHCWIGSASATQSNTGPVGFMAGGVSIAPPAPAGSHVCTQWSVRFIPGNPGGWDPNTTYALPSVCG
jgi:hypothetical protein